MITDEHKDNLLCQWAACNSRTKVKIAATFLKKIKDGKQKYNWWTYLEKNLPKSTISKAQ